LIFSVREHQKIKNAAGDSSRFRESPAAFPFLQTLIGKRIRRKRRNGFRVIESKSLTVIAFIRKMILREKETGASGRHPRVVVFLDADGLAALADRIVVIV
jgi:hypothetical protein